MSIRSIGSRSAALPYLVILFFLFICKSPLSAQFFLPYQDSLMIDHGTIQVGALGGGAAFFDYDNDGDEDLYLIGGAEMDRLYVNNGDGSFTDRSVEAGLFTTTFYYTTGVIAGDTDNDGDNDLFVTTWFGDSFDKNVLLRNNGNGTFSDIWVQLEEEDMAQSMGATFIDFDLDGLLDIYVINYVEETIFTYNENNQVVGYEHICSANRFYHNLGNGLFEEIGEQVGLADTGCGLAVIASDYDMDGDLDILLANDFGPFIEPNRLFRNEYPEARFTEVGADLGMDLSMYGMGIAVGDIDQDLDLDYYITNFGKNALMRNDSTHFTEITDQSQTGDEWVYVDSTLAVGWGTALLDIDNDSDLDLYVANGMISSPDFLPTQVLIKDKLFRNESDGTFSDVSEAYGITNPWVARGMSYSDYDDDGDLDIISVVLNIPPNDPGWETVIYNNQEGNQNNWLQLSLLGHDVNRNAFGSKVYLYCGDKVLLHELSGGGSHASSWSPRAHFGLGEATVVDSIQVHWTGGFRRQTIFDIPANQHLLIEEDTTIIVDTVPIVGTRHLSIDPARHDYFLSPNPAATGPVVLDRRSTEPVALEALVLFDVTGAAIKQWSWEVPGPQMPLRLDPGPLPNGLYYLQIQTRENRITLPLIIGR